MFAFHQSSMAFRQLALRPLARPHGARPFLTAAAYNLAKKQMPKMSETEKVALGCGTVGFDLS